MKSKYIMTMGTLSRKDNSLDFKNEKGHNYIPIEGIREIYILNEVSVNSKLLSYLSKFGIILHFFDYFGHYTGTYYPKEKYISGKLLIKQVYAFMNKREKIAKSIIKGIIENIHFVLYHYYKHGTNEVKPFLNDLKKLYLKNLEKDINISQIMAIEGAVWQNFYNQFRFFLNEDFVFNKRVKRPPDNPINALISFGNSLLYTKTISQIYRTHLDQSISFLHEPVQSRFSLSLDLSESFKPLIVFKTIFDLVNHNILKVKEHFDNKLNYCILNPQGRKIFIKAFEERLEKKFKHGKLKRLVSYNTAIKIDGYKLIKDIMEDKSFIPFIEKVKV